MGEVVDRIRRLGKQSAIPSDEGSGVGQINEREQAIIDRHTSEAPSVSVLQKVARGLAQEEIEARRQQRAQVEQAPLSTVEPVREMLSSLGNRSRVLEILRQMTPEQRQQALALAPGIAQQLGDDRGGVVGRTLGAISRGISHGVSQPAVELAGQLTGTDWGGTPEEIEFIRQLDAAASQEFNPSRPGDPWYERGPLQATEMVPWMTTVVGGAGLGRAAAGQVAGRVAGGAAAGGKVVGAVQKAGQAVGNLPTTVTSRLGMRELPAITAGKVGELAGITAAAFPSQYAQEVDSLKEMGMEDSTKLRLLAAGTAAITGLVEGIVPNPFKTGPVPLDQGAIKAARQYLWEAAKQAPGEMSEEYLQGVTSGLGQHVAQYLDENVEDKSIADAFKTGWEQAKEAALPMAFLLGVPAVGGAGLAANQARLARLREIRAKGFVSTEDAKKEGIAGNTRKERLANADAEIEQLQSDVPIAKPGTPPTTPAAPTAVSPPPLPQGTPNASQVQPNEGSPQVQGNVGQGSQEPSSGQVRVEGQDQGGTKPTSEEPAAPQVQVDDAEQSSFENYAAEWNRDLAKRLNKPETPVTDKTRESLKKTLDWLADSAIKEGKAIKFASDNPALDELQMKELQNVLQRKGYDSSDIERSSDNGVEYIGFTVSQKPAAETPAKRQPDTLISEEPTKSEARAETGLIWSEQQGSDGIKTIYDSGDFKIYEAEDGVFTASQKGKNGQEYGLIPEFASLKQAQAYVDKIVSKNAKETQADVDARNDRISKGKDLANLNQLLKDNPDVNAIATAEKFGIDPSDKDAVRKQIEQLTKPTAGSPTVSPDAPATGTRKGEAEGESLTTLPKHVADRIGGSAPKATTESKWQSETRTKLGAVPALNGAKIEADERSGTVKVTRPDGLATTIYFNADEELAKAATSKGRKPETIHGRYVRKPGEKTGSIYLRSDADHTSILNHEVMHWLEDQGVVTAGEVEQYGGREQIAEKYGKWASLKQRNESSGIGKVFKRIRDFLDPVFSSQKRFFEEVSKRGVEQKPKPQPSWSEQSQKNYVKQKRALSKAQATKDPQKILEAAEQGLASFQEFGEPDDWSRWVRAKEDAEQAIKRAKPQESLSQDKKTSAPKPPAGYKPLAEFTPVVDVISSPDLSAMENLEAMRELQLQPGEAVGYRVYPKKGSLKGGYWQYGTVSGPPAGSHAAIQLADGTKDMVAGSRLHRLEPIEADASQPLKIDDHVRVEGTDIAGSVGAIQASKGVLVNNFEGGSAWYPLDKVRKTERQADFVDDFTAAVNAAFDERFGESKPLEDKQESTKPRKPTGRKKTKPTLSEQAAARKERTSAKKAEKLQKFKDLLKQKKITSGFDPELATAAVELTEAAIDDGVSTFFEYVAWIADSIGESATRKIAPYLEAGWARLGTYDRFRGKIDRAGKVADVLASKVNYGTLEAPNRVELGKHFQQQLESGKDYKSIVEARKEAATLISGEDANIEPGTPAAKAIDEAVEQGVVRAARSLAESSSDPLKVYDRLLDLYERQPRLNVRTGTSMRMQAYSTPAPAAWIANILSDTSRDNTAYDSSAGNGMLLLGVDPENAIANELNPDRAQALRELGYQVHEGDATEYTPAETPDRIIINPPFGELEGKKWSVGGITTDKIDHAIVLKSLESLPADGKAVLIIGSKGFEQRQPKDELRRGEAYKNEKNFYNTLYDGYNVTDHFTLHGDMYSKQGAAFPIDVIVIDGRGKSELPKPYQIDRKNAIPRVINNWQELRDVGERYLDTGTGRPSDLSTEQVKDDMGGLSALLEGQDQGTSQEGEQPSQGAGGRGSVSSGRGAESKQPGGDSGSPSISVPSDKSGSGKSKRVSSENKSGATARPDERNDATALDRGTDVGSEDGLQAPYKQRSGARNVGTLVPATHARAVQEALEKAEIRYGNLDEFVSEELGYTVDELRGYFSAEQVDALALNIARHKEGKAFVLGDQTGVGKGRVAAATMVYAKRQGLVPVFMTQSPDLFADMYRDLQDIGQHSEGEPFYALATNTLTGKDKIELPDGTVITQTAAFSKDTINEVSQNVAAGNGPIAMITVEKTTDASGNPLGKNSKGKQRVRKVKEQREYDAVFSTYSQMQTVGGDIKDRHSAMSVIAPKTFFILDESHNAGGARTGQGEDSGPVGRAARLRHLVSEAQGVLFLSATYAKNPDVMDLYAKTGMADAVEGAEEGLIETIVKGGIPLQQVLSEMLVESGAYMRREKSFDGIKFNATVKETGEEEAGEVAGIFDAINVLDKIKNEITKTKSFKRWLTAQGLGLGKDSATGKMGLDSYTFSSIVHNLVDQMLLSIKADAVADEAIATLKRGESPIIALSNTAGAALDNYLKTFPANIGDEIDFGFNSTAQRYLERSREIMLTDVDASGKKTSRRVRLPDEVLGEDGLEAYNAARYLIDSFAADIPASPIDHIRNRIEQAGYKVAEITGRDLMVDYSGDQMRLTRRPSEEQGKAGKLASVRGYNSGEIDVLILNQSGSTGLSAHASDKFKNQKRRHMIIAQADKNIDTFMQMLGRINRTGQVEQHEGQEKGSNLPYYTLLMTNVPAEIRPASVLIKKLSSLNANVTADSKGSVSFDAPDILNKVGDRVVAEYIADNPALNDALGDIVEVNADGSPRVVPDIARKVSGRMAMRPIAEQQAFWDSVTETYTEEIEQLNKLGKNPLTATKLDLGARVLERVEIFAGDSTADSPFLQPAYADRVRVKKQGEPMTPEEIKSSIAEFYGKEPNEQMIRDWSANQIEIAEKAIDAHAEQQSARMVNAEAIMRVEGRAEGNKAVMRRRLNSIAPGMAIDVSESQEGGGYVNTIRGIVIDVKAKKGKEHLPTGWVATIAISSPDRVLRMPFSRIENSSNLQPGDVYVAPSYEIAGESMYENWEQTGDVYEERIVGTGNVLAAFDRLVSDEHRGNIVFFTDEEGVSQRGVLMPRNFNLNQWAEKRPVTFATPQQVLDFLSIDSGHQVNDPQFAIQFTLDGSTMNVRSPRSRQRSGKYTTNQELIAASGTDFVSVGQILQMKVRGKEQQLAVIEAAQKLGPLIAANYKEDARDIAGETSRIDVGVVNRSSVASGTAQQSSSADFSFTEGETPRGRRLLNKMKRDSVKRKIGPRSIMNYLKDVVRTGSIEGKSQLSRRNPGHYKPREHLVRTRTGASGVIDTHEAGHALSALLRDVDPKVLKRHQAGLVALTHMPNSMASAKTAEEGMAEFVRRYIVDYQSIPESLRTKLEGDIEMVSPELLAGLKDTNRLWQQFLARPLQERLDASKNDRLPRKIGRGFKAAVYRSLYNIIGGDVAIHKVRRELERPLFQFSQSIGREFRDKVSDTQADVDNAYQSVIRVPVETQRAIFGDSRSKDQGVRVIAFGDNMFSDDVAQHLRDGGFKVPDDFKHGEPVYLTNQSFEQIREKLGDDWDAFENYGQLRASLERAERKGHQSAWMHENISLPEARQAVVDMELANPQWTQLFNEVREFFDALLLVATLSGEYSPLEAVRIRNAWDSYWPLLRQVTPEENSRLGRAGPDPAAGVHRAFGSALPLRNLLEVVEMRTKAAMQAYYTNRMMLAMRKYSDTLHAMNDAPFDIRKAGARLMVPLKMDLKKVATLSPEEQAQWIVDYMNKQLQDEARDAGEDLDPDELYTVEDVAISMPWRPIFRATRPGAIQVIGLTENGQRKYYQVTDPLLFDLFSNAGSMSRYATWLARFFAKGIGPWKRALTQNLAFAVRNLPRDTVTAMTMGESGKSFVPGMYLAYGIVGRLNGSLGKDAPARAELFSRSLEALHHPRHKKVWDSFKEAATEGILVPGYFDMNFYDRVSEAPGQLSAAALWPVTMFNWATGGRYISQMSEELQREGAFREARSRGLSYEAAQRQYDQISGNFSQRQPNHATATFIRSAGFLNPGLQIMWGQMKRWHDPDPRAQKIHLAKLPALAAWFAVSSAINVALVYALFGDDEEKLDEVLNDMRERPDYEKDTTMSVMGTVRLPFEYGLSGAVSSFAWNATQDALLGGSNDSIPTRLKAFLTRATQIPGPTDAIHPYLKTAIELKMGEAGYSMYRNDSIVPEQLIVQYPVNPELRAYDDTPEIFRQIGESSGVSPLKVEYAVGSLLTGTAQDLIALGGKVAGGQSLDAKDIPVLSRLMQRPSTGFRSQAVRELRKSSQEVEALGVKIHNMGDEAPQELLEKYAKLQEVSLAYDVVSSMYDEVQDEVDAAESDRSEVEATERRMTKFARQFLNYQAGKALQPKQLKEQKYKYYGLKAYQATGEPESESGIKLQEQAMAALMLSGYTLQQARDALIDHWETTNTTENERGETVRGSVWDDGKGVLKPSVDARLDRLIMLYSEQTK